jgi:hypothetical protein
MPRGRTTFRQRDAEALIRAARKAGLEIERVEAGKDGKIVVITTNGAMELAKPDNEWDTVLETQKKDED